MARDRQGKLEVAESAPNFRPGYAVASCDFSGTASSAVFAPYEFELWLVVVQLEAGGTLEWKPAHGDEGIYVKSGSLDIDGISCGAGSAVIVESEVAAVAHFRGPCTLVHVGSSAPASSSSEAHVRRALDTGVHVFSGELEPIQVGSVSHRYYADSTCPTCRIAFFRIDSSAEYASPSHVHSEDEIIHVLSGSLQFGRQAVGPGSSVAISAGRRYGFRATEPFSFLNYRADASTVTMAPGSRALEESARAVRKIAERSH